MTSCAKTDGSSSVELEEKEDAMQIGLSIDSLVIERWTKERDLFVAKADSNDSTDANWYYVPSGNDNHIIIGTESNTNKTVGAVLVDGN